jgi:hypothetical protein
MTATCGTNEAAAREPWSEGSGTGVATLNACWNCCRAREALPRNVSHLDVQNSHNFTLRISRAKNASDGAVLHVNSKSPLFEFTQYGDRLETPPVSGSDAV